MEIIFQESFLSLHRRLIIPLCGALVRNAPYYSYIHEELLSLAAGGEPALGSDDWPLAISLQQPG